MSKLVSLADAVGDVGDGSHVAFGGFSITRCVVAAAHALVRAGRRDLTLSHVIGGLDTDLLVGGGCVRRLLYAGGSLDRFGSLHAVNHAILDGRIEVEEYSSLAMTLRFHAASLGLPFVPTKTMLGSALLDSLPESSDGVRLERDPFTGSPVVALAPLRPDFAFVHVDVADESGNAALGGPTWALRETAFAARRTVVLAEEIVPVGSLDPDAVAIPSPFVSAVAHVPVAAHPTAVLGLYDYDGRHLEIYAAAAREGGPAYADYLDEYVLGTDSHEDYLVRVGIVGTHVVP
jgi:glutaconate CoA-transferase subunit A